MTVLSEKSRSEFIFVGDHPAIDFANTLSISQGQWIDHLRVWTDVIDWLSLAGLSTDPALQIPTSRSAEALKSVMELRRAWKIELDKLVAGGKVSDDFIKQLNHLLAESVSVKFQQRYQMRNRILSRAGELPGSALPLLYLTLSKV